VCETKSKDNVFVQVCITVQYRVLAKQAYDAFYRLTDPRVQMQSYVFDVIRSTFPRMDLDGAFSSKAKIVSLVKERLDAVMLHYGYEIIHVLVTDIQPNQKVKMAMNEMNASKRMKEAMPHQAQAAKVKLIKAAEAKAEAAYLSGVGVANERQAIANGMKESVIGVSDINMDPGEIMDILLLTQYMDTLTSIGCDELILNNSISEVADLRKQVQEMRTGVNTISPPPPPKDLLW